MGGGIPLSYFDYKPESEILPNNRIWIDESAVEVAYQPARLSAVELRTDRNEIVQTLNTKTISNELFASQRELVPVIDDMLEAINGHSVRGIFSQSVKVQSKTLLRRLKNPSLDRVAHDAVHVMAAEESGSHKGRGYDYGQLVDFLRRLERVYAAPRI